jgi:predicted ATPase/DNA-binding CsgD family transcriptional regulator
MMPATGRARLGNLSTELTSFVGRGSELAEAKRRLADARLVTLTGVGGTGKTRLALRVAAEVRRAFTGGTWFVDLTQLREPHSFADDEQDADMLADLVRSVLGIGQQGGGPPTRQLTDHLAGRQVLLVLDNCEHLIPACATLVDTLLRTCPELRVLATSREPLGTTGEVLYPVPPLPVPAPGRRLSPAGVGHCESVALFVARARSAVPDFALTGENADAVGALCRRLDGLPLAIELAAARIRMLAPDEILDRLSDRFALLARGSRTAPPRQQTLRACAEWSFDLCDPAERVLWGRASVFVGGFELDAAERVCADEALPEADILEVVTGLVDKSILVRDDARDGGGGTARYRMLETIREFGGERLAETGEDETLRRRRRAWCQTLTEHAAAEWISARQVYWYARLTSELPNLRAAIEHALTEPGQAEAALRLVVTAPLSYWWDQGLFSEIRRWLDTALAHPGPASHLRARAMLFSAQLAITQGDAEAGIRLADRGEDLARRLGATVELAYAAFVRGILPMYGGDMAAAADAFERTGAILASGPAPGPGLALELNIGRLTGLGVTAGLLGDHQRADACYQQVLTITEPTGELRDRAHALWGRAMSAWHQGKAHEAEASMAACLPLVQALGSTSLNTTAMCIEAAAWAGAGRQRYELAATLLGAADALLATIGTPIKTVGYMIDGHEACERQTRAGLGDAAFTAAFTQGQTLSYDEAIAYALDGRPPSEKSPSTGRPTPLTRRERQVADLITEGLSNKEIAGVLVVSQRTAESHVENILAKLGFTSRAQVAAWNAVREPSKPDGLS